MRLQRAEELSRRPSQEADTADPAQEDLLVSGVIDQDTEHEAIGHGQRRDSGSEAEPQKQPTDVFGEAPRAGHELNDTPSARGMAGNDAAGRPQVAQEDRNLALGGGEHRSRNNGVRGGGQHLVAPLTHGVLVGIGGRRQMERRDPMIVRTARSHAESALDGVSHDGDVGGTGAAVLDICSCPDGSTAE